jgi:hypothetical protein
MPVPVLLNAHLSLFFVKIRAKVKDKFNDHESADSYGESAWASDVTVLARRGLVVTPTQARRGAMPRESWQGRSGPRGQKTASGESIWE